MVHTLTHCTYYGVYELSRWSFVVQNAVWLYNHMPNRKTDISLMEMLTSTKSDCRYLQLAHIWGCPTYVLNPKLQNDQTIPKFNFHYLLGQFVGFSNENSLLVANVRNLQTCYVSPQYHCVFGCLF